jgi:hypothetical protein
MCVRGCARAFVFYFSLHGIMCANADQGGVHVLIDPYGHLLVHADDGGELLVPVCV